MNTLLARLNNSTDIDVAAKAADDFVRLAKQAGRNPQEWYAELSAKEARTMSKRQVEKRSKVSFSDVLLPGAVAKRTDNMDMDDEMSDEERRARGVAAAARGEDGDDIEPDNDPDDEVEDDAKSKGRTIAGTTAKHTLSKGVSFTNIVAPASKTFPLEEQESARQPRRVDTGEDALGRSYADGVLERLGGGLTGSRGDTSGIPNAGAGETWEGESGDVNSGFKPLANRDAAMIGGAERPYTPSNPGRDGAYKLEAEGLEPGAGVVRSGPNFILPGKSGGEGLSAPFIAPEPRKNVLKSEDDAPVKSEDRGSLFRSVLNEDSMKPFDGRE